MLTLRRRSCAVGATGTWPFPCVDGYLDSVRQRVGAPPLTATMLPKGTYHPQQPQQLLGSGASQGTPPPAPTRNVPQSQHSQPIHTQPGPTTMISNTQSRSQQSPQGQLQPQPQMAPVMQYQQHQQHQQPTQQKQRIMHDVFLRSQTIMNVVSNLDAGHLQVPYPSMHWALPRTFAIHSLSLCLCFSRGERRIRGPGVL